MLFVKAAKAISLGILFIPFTGCAIGVGLIFAALVKSISYAPDFEEIIFNYAMLGFAFIETFAFLLFFILAIIIAF
jgi:F0F1-type ATP synthase membrane subunit c/vacuolar-type H+-ATPase subunit K